jgi:hypothetical protein
MEADLWDEPGPTEPTMGPVFMAEYESEDACCGDGIVPGEDIRGYRGGWIHADDQCEKLARTVPGETGDGREVRLCPRCTAIHAGEC